MHRPTFDPDGVAAFRYGGFDLDDAEDRIVVTCRYALDNLSFVETVSVGVTPERSGTDETVFAAARLVYLLAGISYFKAAAPPRIELPDDPLSETEAALLAAFYVDGLGEYAYRNQLELTGLTIDAPRRDSPAPTPPPQHPQRPLIPFGGGIDSIVTVEGVRSAAPAADLALFVMSRPDDHFAAIEAPLATSALPVIRAWRTLDPKILESTHRGYRNGHVPVTGILSAIALLAAAANARDAVVMSNEWSASAPNLEHRGRPVNHQWSKSLHFEELLRSVLATSPLAGINYHSWLRCRSELWVARRFASHSEYHPTFRSCNRAFTLDPLRRADQWCGTCDKCCFIDLILAPYVDADALAGIFGGHEPLRNGELAPAFDALCGLSSDAKPFECVGDTDECRVAATLATRRDDRTGDALLERLATSSSALMPGDPSHHADTLLAPLGAHHVPPGLAPDDLRSPAGPVPESTT